MYLRDEEKYMQQEIIETTDLLDDRGYVKSPGYARMMRVRYNREKVRTHPFGLKEWDFYQVLHGDWVMHLTIGHVSYVASISADLVNLRDGRRAGFNRMRPLPLRSLPMPCNPETPHTLKVNGKDYSAFYDVDAKRRHLVMKAEDKKAGRVEIDITIPNNPENEKMVIVTPFPGNPRQFYLNYKENYWGAEGSAKIGDIEVEFDNSTVSLMDWGRGVWPFKHEWFWGSGTGWVNDAHFGFNIGWGFGDTSNATENFFFYKDKAYKLGMLTVTREENDYMKPWHFISEGNDFDFIMEPVFDNYTETKLLFVNTHCHQVFGNWSGKAVLPDGKALEIEKLTAFCEHAENRW